MVKVLRSIVLALDIDDDVTFLQDFRVAGAGDGRILVCWGEAQQEHGERFVSMEGATTRRVIIWIVCVLPVCSDPSRCRSSRHLGRISFAALYCESVGTLCCPQVAEPRLMGKAQALHLADGPSLT